MTTENSDAGTPGDGVSAAPAPESSSEGSKQAAKQKQSKTADTPIPPAAKAKIAARERGKKSPTSRTPVHIGSPRWVVPLMVVLFLIGLVWIVAYYVAPDAPLLSTLGWWNVVVGFGFLAGGFLVATRWR